MKDEDLILDNDFPENNIPDDNRHMDPQDILSLNKFILLSVLTLGLYEIWWMYKAWRFFKQKDNLDIKPAARAMFSMFFLHALFEKIKGFAKQKGTSASYASTWLFIGFVLFTFLSRLPEPYWLISVLSIVFLIPPFQALNEAKLRSSGFIVKEPYSFNARQIGLLIAGTIVWILIFIELSSGTPAEEFREDLLH